MDAIVSALQAARQQVAAGALDTVYSDASLVAWEQQIRDTSSFCISHMRRLRNYRTAGVHRLPNELLVDIFRTLEATLSWKWIYVTEVCTRWRQLALGTPSLWATIDYDMIPPRYIDLMLQRSRDMSLTVRSKSNINPLDFCDVFCDQAHRIRGLWLVGDNSLVIMDSLMSYLSGLERLGISSALDSNELPSWPYLPKLRSLEACNLRFRSVLPWMRCLRSLELEDISDIPDIPSLLNALAACPCIEHLDIRNSLPESISHDDPDCSCVVDLPNLKLLLIEDTAKPEIQCLCSCLAISAHAVIRIEVVALDIGPGELLYIPNAFPQRVSQWEVLTAAKHIGIIIEEHHILVTLSPELHDASDELDAPCTMSLRYYWEDLSFHVVAVLSRVLQYCADSLASPDIVHLSIRCQSHPLPPYFPQRDMTDGSDEDDENYTMMQFTAGVWPRVLASFPGLQCLELKCPQNLESLFEALGTPAPGCESLPCADLRSLTVSRIANTRLQDTLRNALSIRASCGRKLEQLVLGWGAGEQSEFVEVVRKYVGSVTVDCDTTAAHPGLETAEAVQNAAYG